MKTQRFSTFGKNPLIKAGLLLGLLLGASAAQALTNTECFQYNAHWRVCQTWTFDHATGYWMPSEPVWIPIQNVDSIDP